MFVLADVILFWGDRMMCWQPFRDSCCFRFQGKVTTFSSADTCTQKNFMADQWLVYPLMRVHFCHGIPLQLVHSWCKYGRQHVI